MINRQPGANMVSEKSLVATAILNGAFFVGLFTFAVGGWVGGWVAGWLAGCVSPPYLTTDLGH